MCIDHAPTPIEHIAHAPTRLSARLPRLTVNRFLSFSRIRLLGLFCSGSAKHSAQKQVKVTITIQYFRPFVCTAPNAKRLYVCIYQYTLLPSSSDHHFFYATGFS